MISRDKKTPTIPKCAGCPQRGEKLYHRSLWRNPVWLCQDCYAKMYHGEKMSTFL